MENEKERVEGQKQEYMQNDYISKSNLMISAKYKATLQTLRINYLNQYKIQKGEYLEDPETKEIVVELYPQEIVEMAGLTKGGSFYRNLESVARQMVSTYLGITDPEKEQFEYISIVTKSEYKNGVFTTRFHRDMKQYMMNISTKFTVLPRISMMSWKTTYSYRLYEELKKNAFYPKNYSGNKNGIFIVSYDVYELRLLLGVVNSNLESVRKVLDGTNPPDYKKACEASPEKMYVQWKELKRSVIDAAIKEINNSEHSDIKVEYETLKKARGEVYAIKFTIYLKEFHKDMEKDKEEELLSFKLIEEEEVVVKKPLTLMELFKIQKEAVDILEFFNVSEEDSLKICEKAEYDIEKIKIAANILKNQKEVKNVVGWLMDAIEKGYKEPTKYKGKKKNQFLEFEQSDTDYEALEKEIFENM